MRTILWIIAVNTWSEKYAEDEACKRTFFPLYLIAFVYAFIMDSIELIEVLK